MRCACAYNGRSLGMEERTATVLDLTEMLGIVAEMITLFLIVGVGYGAKKFDVMTEDFDKALSKVIINLTLPALILGSVLTAAELPSFENILITFAVSCASYVLVIIIAYLFTAVFRVPWRTRGVFKFMLCFGNVGFIGFPVLTAIYGPEALIYATVFNLPFNFLVFTIGAWFLTQDSVNGAKIKLSWRILVSPAIVSCTAAIVLVLLDVHSVPVIGEAFQTLGSLTTPAALLIIGSSLANMPASKLIGGFRIWSAAAFRLLIIPVITWFVFHFFVTNPLLLGVIVVISGMPVATNGTMLCYQYGGNTQTMAQGTFVTTILSMLTIPVVVGFLQLVA